MTGSEIRQAMISAREEYIGIIKDELLGPGSEFSLPDREGRPDAFPRILRKAIANAKTCSNDPVCIMSRGQGRDSLNLAACHACGLLPETCCEERNAFLDRGVIVGTYENPEIGFWNDIDL